MITLLLILQYSNVMCAQTSKEECKIWAEQCLIDKVFVSKENIELAYEHCAEALPTEYYK